MSDKEIIIKATAIIKDKQLNYLLEKGFIDLFKLKIALIRQRYFEYQKQGETVMQSLTNCSIDFGVSEGTVKKYVYSYNSVSF